MSKQKQATRSLSANECPAGILLPRESLTIRQEKYKHPFGCFIFLLRWLKKNARVGHFIFTLYASLILSLMAIYAIPNQDRIFSLSDMHLMVCLAL